MKVISAIKIGNMKDPDPERRGRVAVLDLPCPPLGEEDVKVKVAYCGICGSDPHVVGGIFGWEPPFGMGHEASGVIVELGARATRNGLKVGDRVAANFRKYCGTCYYCRNGQEQFCEHATEQPAMAEYVIWHESQVLKLPDTVSLREGSLLEPVSIAVRVTDKADVKVGARVFVSGGGPIGLLCLSLLKIHGAVSLTLSEPVAARRELALRCGADHVLDPTSADIVKEGLAITGGSGYDLVLEVSGVTRAAETMPDLTANGGKLIYVAMYPNTYRLPLNLYEYCYRKEISVTGTFVAPYAFPRAVQLLPRLDLSAFTDCVYDIDDPEGAFDAHLSGKHPKVLIRCNKDLD